MGTSAKAERPDSADAIERYVIGDRDALVVSRAGDAPLVAVCAADRETAVLRAPDPLALARRGGTERHEHLGAASMWCATLPSSELGFALWLAAHLRSPSPGPEISPGDEAAPDLDPMRGARALSLEGASSTEPAASHRVVSVAGNVSGTDVTALAARYLGKVSEAPPLGRPSPSSWSLHQTSERLSVTEGAAETPQVRYGWAAPETGPDIAVALEVVFEILAGGDDARLPRLLVPRGLARRVGTWSLREGGGTVLGVVIETTTRASIDRVRRFVDGSLKQLRLVGPGAREVSRVLAGLRKRALETWENPEQRAETLAEYELLTGDARRFSEELQSVAAMTPERVRSVAHDLLVDAHRTTLETYPTLWPADDPAMAHHRLYTVAVGDTLETIAARFHVDAARLAKDNDVDPRYRLMPGQPLWIPP